jgi:hypothetical protein
LPESNKFVEITNDSRFPPTSVIHWDYRDSGYALSSVDVFSKYGLITYLANASDINLVLSASEVDIGNVGMLDNSTTVGQTVFAQVINDQPNGSAGALMGSIRVRTELTSLTSKDFATDTSLRALTANQATAANQVRTNTLLDTLTASNGTAVNQVITNTLLNTVTANLATEITLQKVLTGKDFATDTNLRALTAVTYNNIVTNTVAISTAQTLPVSGSVTIISPVTSVQVYTNSNTLTVSGNTAVTNTVAISTTQTLPVSGSVTITNNISTTPVGIQQVSYADGYQLDQSGRLRVAMIGNQWWYTSSIDKDGDVRFQEAFAGEGQSIYVQNYAATLMTSGSASGGSAIRQTRRRFPLRPGIGQQWFSTWNWDGNDAGVVKRCGWNTQYNGMFFELSGGNMNVVVRRRLPDGTLNESRVSRNEFNGDKLNGSGPSAENWNLPAISAFTTTLAPTVTAVAVQNALSAYNVRYRTTTAQAASAFIIGSKVTVQGFSPITFNGCAVVKAYDTTNSTIDLTYPFNPGTYISGVATGSIIQNAYHGTHTYFLDVFGGRTNRVRFGKITDNGEIILHTFQFDGAFGGCFTSAPTMPVRKEIFTTQNVNLRPTMSLLGVSVNTEAEVELNPSFAVAHNNNYLRLDYNTPQYGDLNEYPLLGVGLRAGEPYQRGDIQIQSVGIMDIRNIGGSNNGGALFWRLVLNPTLSGTIPAPTNIGKASRHWEYTVADHSTNGVNISAGAASQGIELLAGYAASVGTIDTRTSLNFLNLGSNVDNTDADKVVLFVRQLSPAAADAQVVANLNIIEAI